MSDSKTKTNPILPNQNYDCDAVVPFSVKKNKFVKWYCVGQMSGTSRDQYLSEMKNNSNVTKDAEGNISVDMKSFEGMSTSMLKHCVYGYSKESESTDDILVKEEIIASWPSPLIDSLVITASNLNGLGDPETTVGNDSAALK